MGLIRLILLFFVFLSYSQEHVLIGDSQTFYLNKHSKQIKQIKKLSKSGIGVYGLTKKISPYPISRNVKTVSLCIGVNDNYKDVGIKDLMNTIKRTFPNSKIYIIQGSWGWGHVRKYNSSSVLKYYQKFKEFDCKIIEPPIGLGDPHRDKKIYKTIITKIEYLINKNNE